MEAAVYLGYAVSFSLFAWLVVPVKSQRRVVAVTVATVLVFTLVSPKPAQAQGNLIGSVQAVINVINGECFRHTQGGKRMARRLAPRCAAGSLRDRHGCEESPGCPGAGLS